MTTDVLHIQELHTELLASIFSCQMGLILLDLETSSPFNATNYKKDYKNKVWGFKAWLPAPPLVYYFLVNNIIPHASASA